MSGNEDVFNMRLSQAGYILGVSGFGTLRFVPEEIWKAKHLGYYDKNSTRKGHVGCSLRRISSDCSLEPIHILHGKSKKTSRAVPVMDLFKKGSSSFFGGLPPVPISAKVWLRECQTGPLIKTRLSHTEEIAIKTLAHKKGWL